MRVGMGYDVHKLVEGRDLIIGGVKIPHTLGLLGHSDADVLCRKRFGEHRYSRRQCGGYKARAFR